MPGFWLSAAQVCGPTIPSTVRFCCVWKALTAASVAGPKSPSTVRFAPQTFSRVCSVCTAGPVSPSVSVGSEPEPLPDWDVPPPVACAWKSASVPLYAFISTLVTPLSVAVEVYCQMIGVIPPYEAQPGPVSL